jgi:hypothetical protein
MADEQQVKNQHSTSTPVSDEKRSGSGIATSDANAKLEHTEGGVTTRDDKTDLGVPMLPGSGDEPVGPEDALGEGPKRGDYSKRLGDANYAPHETKRIADAKPGEAHTEVVEQAPRVNDVGDESGKKGGVETSG